MIKFRYFQIKLMLSYWYWVLFLRLKMWSPHCGPSRAGGDSPESRYWTSCWKGSLRCLIKLLDETSGREEDWTMPSMVQWWGEFRLRRAHCAQRRAHCVQRMISVMLSEKSVRRICSRGRARGQGGAALGAAGEARVLDGLMPGTPK